LKILFDHPNPFFLAHGGFQIQIEQTKRALEEIGCEVGWLRWWDASRKADLIHYFGRPHPGYIRQCHDQGLKVVMLELLTGLGSRSSAKRFLQRWMTQAARISLPHEFTIRMGWDSYRLADRVIALTAWEKKLMTEMFKAPFHRVHVVPNGVEKVFLEDRGKPVREDHLVTTVTITPRKRVVEMMQAAALARVKLRVIGKPYHPQDPYYLLFLQALQEARPWVEYVGPIEDRALLAGEYRKAAGFFLLSAMESQSLSALEAAACGCPLLLSNLPWARASFGSEASYAPVAPAPRTASYLRAFAERISEAPRVQKVLSWQEVAEQLKGIYLEAITSR
jgi:glycosyltransferase involved in cell wall biosynthesis